MSTCEMLHSRFILAWLLLTSMQAGDVTETLDLARARTGVDRVQVVHRPRLLSDNGPATMAGGVSSLTASVVHTHLTTYIYAC